MKTFFIILMLILLIVSFVMLIICIDAASGSKFGGKLYMQIFEHKLWKGWEKVVENFDNIRFNQHHQFNDCPSVNNYEFILPIGECECELKYWEWTDTVSVHYFPDGDGETGCLCDFDKYHQEVVKDLLCEKFDFMKEVMGKE